MPKQVKDALSAVTVRQIKTPGRYADGNGLYLVVTGTGARMWQWRGTVQGRRRELGMGSVSFLSLKEARERARDWRRIAHEGGDPTEFRDRQKRELLTFADAAERCWSDRIDGKLRSERSSVGVAQCAQDLRLPDPRPTADQRHHRSRHQGGSGADLARQAGDGTEGPPAPAHDLRLGAGERPPWRAPTRPRASTSRCRGRPTPSSISQPFRGAICRRFGHALRRRPAWEPSHSSLPS